MPAPSLMASSSFSGLIASDTYPSTVPITSGSFTLSAGSNRALIVVATMEGGAGNANSTYVPSSVKITGESNQAHLVGLVHTDDSVDMSHALYVLWDDELPAAGSYTFEVDWGSAVSWTAAGCFGAVFDNVRQYFIPKGPNYTEAFDAGSPTTISLDIEKTEGVDNHLLIASVTHGHNTPTFDALSGFTQIFNTGWASQACGYLGYKVDTSAGWEQVAVDPSTSSTSFRMQGIAVAFHGAQGSYPTKMILPDGTVFMTGDATYTAQAAVGGGNPKFNGITSYTSINGVSTFTSINGVTG